MLLSLLDTAELSVGEYHSMPPEVSRGRQGWRVALGREHLSEDRCPGCGQEFLDGEPRWGGYCFACSSDSDDEDVPAPAPAASVACTPSKDSGKEAEQVLRGRYCAAVKTCIDDASKLVRYDLRRPKCVQKRFGELRAAGVCAIDAMACIVSEKEASVRTTVKVRMRVNELHDRMGRSSSTRRRLGLEALKHAPSVWVPERCRPLRFDRLSFTTRRRLLRKYWELEGAFMRAS